MLATATATVTATADAAECNCTGGGAACCVAAAAAAGGATYVVTLGKVLPTAKSDEAIPRLLLPAFCFALLVGNVIIGGEQAEMQAVGEVVRSPRSACRLVAVHDCIFFFFSLARSSTNRDRLTGEMLVVDEQS